MPEPRPGAPAQTLKPRRSRPIFILTDANNISGRFLWLS